MLIMVCNIQGQNKIALNIIIHVGGISTHCGYALVTDCYKCLNHVFVVTVV